MKKVERYEQIRKTGNYFDYKESLYRPGVESGNIFPTSSKNEFGCVYFRSCSLYKVGIGEPAWVNGEPVAFVRKPDRCV